jgi:hypothetical protein
MRGFIRTINREVAASGVPVSMWNQAPFSAFDVDFPLPTERAHQGFRGVEVFSRASGHFGHGQRVISQREEHTQGFTAVRIPIPRTAGVSIDSHVSGRVSLPTPSGFANNYGNGASESVLSHARTSHSDWQPRSPATSPRGLFSAWRGAYGVVRVRRSPAGIAGNRSHRRVWGSDGSALPR